MTESEYHDWVNYHSAIFPRFGEWMLGMTGKHPEPQEVIELREQAMRKAFDPYSGDDLKAASYALWQRPASERPSGYGDHAAALLEILRRPPERHGRRQVNCDRCRDAGFVTATSVPGTATFSAGGVPMPHGVWFSVACDCPAAPLYPEDYKGVRMDRFDRGRHLPWQASVVDADSHLSALAGRGPLAADLSRVLRRFVGGGRK